MPMWWGKSSSSKNVKKSAKENLIGTFHRFLNPGDQKGNTKSRKTGRKTEEAILEKGPVSKVESHPASPSSAVHRCQSFADRPCSQPLPLPGRALMMRTSSDVSLSKPIWEKRGKPQLLLPLPAPNCVFKKPDTNEVIGDINATSLSSNGSADSDDPGDSQLHSPVNNDNGNRKMQIVKEQPRRKDYFFQKNMKEIPELTNVAVNGQHISALPKYGATGTYSTALQNHQQNAMESAPNSLISSPSRSPRMISPDQILSSALCASKPLPDLYHGSGQCSSPGSGQTSGHNSVGGDMLGMFWQPSRGSPECSPIPSPRMTSPGPGSRVHSGSVSPLHPSAGGITPESPRNCYDDGKKKLAHKLPLPPIITSNSSPYNSTLNSPPSLPRSPARIDNPPSPGPHWKKGKMIGRGTFGHVYVGFSSETGEMCAMKEVTLFLDDPKSKESAKQLGQEISLLSRLHHPNIVRYYGSEMIDDKLYIYLEYVSGGSIHKLLQEYGQFGEQAIRSYTLQILSGLAYLHAKNTVHRDIKGANILVDPNGRVKLADFGMAKHINGPSCPFSLKGSPYWMAPEVLKNANGCNLAVDIWSLGCTVLEMATAKPPWSQYEGIAAMFKIGNSKELPAIPDHLSEDGKNFIRLCLQRDPSSRPTAMELLQHSFVKNAASFDNSVAISASSEQLFSASGALLTSKSAGLVGNPTPTVVGGKTILQRRGVKMATMHCDVQARNHISCPVSPISSPLPNFTSPQSFNGRSSPSPISSPRTLSGTSTPLTSGNGVLSFDRMKQSTCTSNGFSAPLRADDAYSGGIVDPKIDLFHGIWQASRITQDSMIGDTAIQTQFHEFGHRNAWDDFVKRPTSRHTYQVSRDQIKLDLPVDLMPSSSLMGRANGH